MDLFVRMIRSKIQYEGIRAVQLKTRLEELIKGKVHEERARIDLIRSRLEGASPIRIMERGYSAVTFPDSRPIKGVSQICKGDDLFLYMADGRADIKVKRDTVEGSRKER